MSLGATGLVALGLYLCALVILTLVARRASLRTPSEFYLGARDLSFFILFFTLYATTYSGNSLLGYPGEAYRRGFSWVMSTGFMMAIMVVFLVLAPRLRRASEEHQLVSPGDYIRLRYGDPALVRLIGAIQALALTNFLLAQLIAMGHVAAGLTGGAIPYAAGVIGLAAVILIYETLGGMRAVAFTDVLQGLLLLFGLIAMFVWLLERSGGMQGVTGWILLNEPSLATVPSGDECRNWVSSLLLLGVGSVVYPQMIQRIYAARSKLTLYRSLALMAWMPLVTVFVVTLVGLSALPMLSGLGKIGADEVMPMVIRNWAGQGGVHVALATMVFIGALAAIMSTADSVLLSLGSVISGDVLGSDRYDPGTTRRGKLAAAALLILMVAVAVAPRITLWRLIELKMEILIQCAPAFLLGVHTRRLEARTVFLGIVAGCTVALWGMWTGMPRLGGVHVGVIGLGVNFAVVLLGSALTPSRRPTVSSEA